jgi:hypothetical protein
MTKSARYRQYAAELRDIGRIFSSGELRSQLLIIAAEWEGLASEAVQGSRYQPFGENSWFWS